MCANPTIKISVSGNTVTITGNISFEGAGAGTHTDGKLLSHLNNTWSGPFGDYFVTTNMTMGTGGLIANVDASPIGQPSTNGLGGSTIQTFTLEGRNDTQFKYTLDSFAHEFGHTLGLMDLYDTKGTKGQHPDYGISIMGVSSVRPSAQNIRDILEKLAAGCS